MNQKTAKEIFWDYSCNHFFLERDGVKEQYIKLGGYILSDECKWRKEFIDFWLNQMSINEIQSFQKLVDAEAGEILSQFIEFNSFRDDYIKFWYAYELLNLSKFSSAPLLRKRATLRAKFTLLELASGSIFLNVENRKLIDNRMLEALCASDPEGYIKNYAQRLLLELK